MENTIAIAFLLSFLAGISTGLGGILGFVLRRSNILALSLGLGFSAGVMIYVSFMEILRDSNSTLVSILGSFWGSWTSIMSFFFGIGIAALIDKLIPDTFDYHVPKIDSTCSPSESKMLSNKLHRAGIFTAIAIALHNFPEGIATFMASLSDLKLGISIAVAIAIHNIPEGVSVALPIYCATRNKNKALSYSFLSGLAEPLGALIAFLLLMPFLNELTLGVVFAIVAGIMVYLSFDELIPMAREYGNGHIEILGLILGMFTMAVSLLLF